MYGDAPSGSLVGAVARNAPQFCKPRVVVLPPHGERVGVLAVMSVRNSALKFGGLPPCSFSYTAASGLPQIGQVRCQYVCGPLLENELL